MSSSSELQQEYSNRFKGKEDYRNSVWEVLVRDYFQHIIGLDKVVLDLGCGWGEFINNVEAREKHAMDLNPDIRAKVNDGVKIYNQDCSKKWEIEKSSLDIVFTSNFLEHLLTKKDLSATLNNAYESLREGGLIVCLGPNLLYTGEAYWDFYDHHIGLTHNSMKEVLELSGFKVKKVVPKFLPYTMSDGSEPPLFFLKLYLKLPFAWKIFGKQFLIVAEKS